MTDPFDPPDLTPARAEPERRRLFSVGFWAMMALCLLCVLAGAAVVAFGPMFTGRGAPPPSPPAAPAASPAATSSLAPAPPAVAGPASDAAIAVSTLTERVARLEGGQEEALQAAADALAASALADAAAQPRPFADALAAYERVLPFSPDARALRPLAAQGAPTRAGLAAALGDAAAAVAVAARQPDRNAGVMANLSYAVSRVVEVRRIEIDRHVANLRAEALAALAAAQAPPQPPQQGLAPPVTP